MRVTGWCSGAGPFLTSQRGQRAAIIAAAAARIARSALGTTFHADLAAAAAALKVYMAEHGCTNCGNLVSTVSMTFQHPAWPKGTRGKVAPVTVPRTSAVLAIKLTENVVVRPALLCAARGTWSA